MPNNSKIKQQLEAYTNDTKRKKKEVIDLYIREGLLARFAQSHLKDQYILKGAAVFQIFAGESHRPTMDIDFLGYGNSKEEYLKAEFLDIIKIPLDDGLKFTELKSSVLGKEQKYEGVRLIALGELEGQPIKGQIDVGFGSAIYPKPVTSEFPTLIGRKAPVLTHYPKETVVAEKFSAIADKGLINSRLKDYYDLVYLSRKVEFQGSELVKAIQTTFNRREQDIPSSTPIGLTSQFASFRKDREKRWKIFFQQGQMEGRIKLVDAITEISSFVMPISKAAKLDQTFIQDWIPGEGWKPSKVNFQKYQQEDSELDLQI